MPDSDWHRVSDEHGVLWRRVVDETTRATCSRTRWGWLACVERTDGIAGSSYVETIREAQEWVDFELARNGRSVA